VAEMSYKKEKKWLEERMNNLTQRLSQFRKKQGKEKNSSKKGLLKKNDK